MKKQPNADASAPSVEVLTTVIEQLRQTVHEQSKMIEELNRTICALKESNVTLVSELRRQIDELKLKRPVFSPGSILYYNIQSGSLSQMAFKPKNETAQRIAPNPGQCSEQIHNHVIHLRPSQCKESLAYLYKEGQGQAVQETIPERSAYKSFVQSFSV